MAGEQPAFARHHNGQALGGQASSLTVARVRQLGRRTHTRSRGQVSARHVPLRVLCVGALRGRNKHRLGADSSSMYLRGTDRYGARRTEE